MNSWILSQPGLQVATDVEILCFRLTVQGKRLVACVGACRPFPVLAFSSDQVSILGWDAVQHLQHCGAYSIVIWVICPSFWRGEVRVSSLANSLQWKFLYPQILFSFHPLRHLWKVLTGRWLRHAHEYHISQKDLLFTHFHYFFSVSFSFSLGISWN